MQNGLILVIDDDSALCELVRTVLTPVGLEVLTAPDGLRGIELARAAKPTVILLDMILPGLGGIRTCQLLKQDPVLARTVVVAITASPDLRYTEQAFRAGAEFFLKKPFGADGLVQVVKHAVERAQVGGRRRTHPRFPLDLPVRCVVEEVMGRVVNASLGGLRLDLAEKLAPGTTFRLQLELPTGIVIAEAKVIWQDDEVIDRKIRHTHGVRLLRFVEDSEFLQYKRFLNEIAVGGRMSAGTSSP
ncbi:MAG TPA: response regulator [Candidatus Methylomirabilis sp.]|nr:response regulator [Candidatus Methylomirabilis sp.]